MIQCEKSPTGEHCWHPTHQTMDGGIPAHVEQRCCYCARPREHGPHAPQVEYR